MVKVATSPEITQSSVSGHLEQNIKATSCPFTDETLSSMTNRARMKRICRLGTAGTDAFKKLDAAAESDGARKQIDMLLMSGIAIRGAT